jgi:hypothetical protein
MTEKDNLKNILVKLSPGSKWHLAGSEELRKKDEDLRKKKLENDITENELTLKKGICCWVKWVVSLYLLFIASILIILVLKIGELEKGVIIALLTTTTINILGLPLMIIKSLFPSKKKQ